MPNKLKCILLKEDIMNNQALIVIDFTYDFIAHDGKLTCGDEGQRIEKALTELVNQYDIAGQYIVLAVDKHEVGDTYHPENALFPPHNITHSPGRELYGSLALWYQQRTDQQHIYYMDKRRYSAFAGTDLDIRLRERNINHITVCGVCTDICVLHTLVDAYNLGYKLSVPTNAVASFDPKGHAWALTHFSSVLGAKLI